MSFFLLREMTKQVRATWPRIARALGRGHWLSDDSGYSQSQPGTGDRPPVLKGRRTRARGRPQGGRTPSTHPCPAMGTIASAGRLASSRCMPTSVGATDAFRASPEARTSLRHNRDVLIRAPNQAFWLVTHTVQRCQREETQYFVISQMTCKNLRNASRPDMPPSGVRRGRHSKTPRESAARNRTEASGFVKAATRSSVGPRCPDLARKSRPWNHSDHCQVCMGTKPTRGQSLQRAEIQS